MLKQKQNNQFAVLSAKQRKKNLINDKTMPYFVLACVVIVLAIIKPQTMSVSYFGLKLDAALPLILLATGQTIVLLTGGIDLSVGGLFSVATCILSTSASPIPAIILIIIIAVVTGIINGLAISRFKVQPFIITLATLTILNGVALMILRTDGGTVPQSIRVLFVGKLFGIPLSLYYIVLVILIWTAIKNTKLGYAMYSLGSNEYAAYCNGVDTARYKIFVYILASMFSVCAGIAYSAQIGSGSPTVGNANNMLSIAAAVIGGTSVSGGLGGVYGTIAGVFVLKLINDILVFAGVSPYWTSFIQGVLLIVAVGISAIAHLVRRKASIYE